MPRNITGGNKAKKRKNHVPKNYNLILKDNNDYDYAQIIGNLGNGLLNLLLLTNKKNPSIQKEGISLLGHIRGKIRRCKFNKDDVVLIGYRDFEKDYKDIRHVDVLHKYTDDHIKELIARNEIKLLNNSYGIKTINEEDDDYIVFSKDNDVDKLNINKYNNTSDEDDSNSESDTDKETSYNSNDKLYKEYDHYYIDENDDNIINIDDI